MSTPQAPRYAVFNYGEVEKALSALKAVDAADLAERRLDELSGGRLQRAVTPGRWSQSPLLDEPTANPRYQPEVMKLVKRLSAGDGPGGGSPRPHLAYTHKVAVPKTGP
jgi:ABC-type cobalamin/Fe3+-siderophores transport system ATPase subunit